ncbi:methionine ABC transporter ATP-binding protein [Acinetobacter larvae]|uniref:Cell division ATP-binding protein FtsE n=1 Tax=Acinetobacter larvae TaxID=1789224 RepID=A0A1B2LYW4_9GAMM|nr:ATP-binding cassette domain-containing protein [Acinetobacter larvae]AOA58152.1 hypothetical protein BFG52_07145 [Acinetobacter larvae]
MIQINNAYKNFNVKNNKIIALDQINLNIEPSEIVGIIGHSGAGKSTLLRLINGLEQVDQGDVTVLGQTLSKASNQQLKILRKQVAMIFQHFNLLKSKTVFENIAFPLGLDAKFNRQQIQQRVTTLAAQLGLTEHLQKYPKQLSGGQKQRVGIARAIANSPKILLCDEATSALDPVTTHEILNLLLKINRELAITLVLITHEMSVIRQICDRVVVLDRGRIVEQGMVDEVLLHPIHPVARSLILGELDLNHIDVPASSMLIRVTALGEFAKRPNYESIAQMTKVDYQIVESRVERSKRSLYSQTILALNGGSVDVFLQQLNALGAHVDVIEFSLQKPQNIEEAA